MIYFKDGFKLADEQITYVHRDEKVTKPIGSEGKDWWFEFEKQWEDMKIIEIKPYKPSDEQLERFEAVKDLPEEKYFEANYYMENGEFPKVEEPEVIKETTLDDIQKTQLTTMEAIGEIYAILAMNNL